jgi:tetratricopeptide (TPR) repeat protein
MRKEKGFLGFIAVLLLAFGSGANADDIFENKYFHNIYKSAMKGKKEEMLAAIKILDERVLAEDPVNPEALIYKGSISAKMAGINFWFWNKLYYVNSGIDLMSKGMDLLEDADNIPDERLITIYIVHGVTCASIPAQFKQDQIALFELERAVKHSVFGDVDNDTKAQVFAKLSRIYRSQKKNDMADSYYKEAMSINPEVAEENLKK